ncbi:YdcF family protein [Noviherbaspirillum sedimenti]|uniref:YdcF family protein n=1 Tax=Noviherbaspirillum sedimenti TaxID=2320865 RepID=A0A3A3G446_9BURK|nr:YdcF family protein [Noviherbaspirillum sedimenti]RJG02701.1 YdcF family protein [Noviherbaspirillum sedimenti]
MSASWIFNTVVGTVLLPPFNLILLAAIGLLVARKRPRSGLALSALALLLLTALSTGIVARELARPLESQNPPLRSARGLEAEAIVVLGGGRLAQAPEYGGVDVPKLTTLGRLRYGAYVQRASGLPLLVSGGSPDGTAEGEAVLMARVLRDELGVPVRWVEDASDNTAQNAQFSARILRAAGVRKIVLVTDALHMPRARRAFEQHGMTVLAAPTVFASHKSTSFNSWLPNIQALDLSYYALHEWLGLLWYQLHDQQPPVFKREA